ncbi:MAG: SIMPL domain-containing protein [Saprospiraceae bacterium]|nr:SIMPL domain-containing protein [Saprospiraceae bacterium]MDZ4706364.1 SIMPL domain-containing protein [Saprospiraceae bacterium]
MMKKLFLGLAVAGIFSFFTVANAQPGMGSKRTITVFGTAEKSVEADEIYLSINLSEYQDDSGLKVGLKELEQRFLKAATDAGIASADIRVENISGFGSYQMEGQGFMASKSYLLKVKNIGAVNMLMSKLGDSGVASANTMYYSHSQVDTYMGELKVQALKNARTKAEMLAAANKQKIVGTLAIEDLEDLGNMAYPGGMGNYSRKPQLGGETKPMTKDVGMLMVNFVTSLKVTFEVE